MGCCNLVHAIKNGFHMSGEGRASMLSNPWGNPASWAGKGTVDRPILTWVDFWARSIMDWIVIALSGVVITVTVSCGRWASNFAKSMSGIIWLGDMKGIKMK